MELTVFIQSGKWKDPYTLQVFAKTSDIDIDHIVSLKHAHLHGAIFWTKEQKEIFANDPMNLLAVEDNANQSKGSKAPQDWMPPNEKFWCEYYSKWVSVKLKYKLSFSIEELDAIKTGRVYKGCD